MGIEAGWAAGGVAVGANVIPGWEGAGLDTPPLEAGSAGPLRARELLSGVGARTG